MHPAAAFSDCDNDGDPGDPSEAAECTLIGGALAIAEILGGGNPAEFCLACALRDYTRYPVASSSGNFWHTFDDLRIPGRGVPLAFSRTYNALSAATNGPLGYGWSSSYDIALSTDPTTLAVTVHQENGSQVTFTPSGASYTAPPRVTATLVKHADGSFTFTRRATESFTFNSAGQVVSESDPNGYVTSVTRPDSATTVVTEPAGRTLTLSYSGGHLTGIADPSTPARHLTFSYDSAGNLVEAVDVSGGHTQFTYDANHRMLTMRQPKYFGDSTTSPAPVVTNTYDGSGRVASQSDQLGRTTNFTYTPVSDGTDVAVTDPRGDVTLDHYMSNGLLGAEVRGYGSPLAATWTYTYDMSVAGLTSVEDPNGHFSSATYDSSGNQLSAADGLSRTTTKTYNSFNEITSMTDAKGVTSFTNYDGAGNIRSQTAPLLDANGNTVATRATTYNYFENGDTHPGDVTSMVDPDSNRWQYGYDGAGNRISTTDPLGDRTTFGYNAIGWKTSETSPRGNVAGGNPAAFTTHWAYNQFGDPTTVTDPLGGQTVTQYDANRNAIQVRDPNGHVTRTSYDPANEARMVTRGDGTTLRTSYDSSGNVSGQTDALNATTTYVYDPLGRLNSTTDPMNRTTRYGYDGAGNRTSMVDPQGQVTSYSYDGANQRTGITYSDGVTPNVIYTYDPDGQRATMNDGLAQGSVKYTYDSLHRLTRSERSAGGFLDYHYDLKGQLTALKYTTSQGMDATRTYDAAGRFASVADVFGDTTRFSYDPDGNLTGETYPNGTSAATTYDAAGRVQHIVDTGPLGTFLDLPYTRDPAGQVTSADAIGFGPGDKETYQYDSINRLVSGSLAVPSSSALDEHYGYDNGDNVTAMTTPSSAQCISSARQRRRRCHTMRPTR